MLVSTAKLPSLTSRIPFDDNNSTDPESRPQSAQGAPNTASQTPSVPQSVSRSDEMAAQYYSKRTEESPKSSGIMLPALAAAIAPGQAQSGRYRSPYSAPEPPRPSQALAPIAPMPPLAPMMLSGSNTPEPPRHRPNLSEGGRASSESQTDEHHDPPQPVVAMPGNNQYTPGVQRTSHPGTPVPTSSGDGSKPPRPRPHVCLTCQRTFARREHLNRHELSHTKEKPFECTECSRCFSRRDLLLRHKQKLHLTNPYVRPRDRAKGDGPADGESGTAPMAQMSGNDGTTGVSIAIHPSGQIQRSHDGGPSSGPPGPHDSERGGPSAMAMAHMRPALPLPRAPQHQSQPPPGSAASLYYQKQDIDVSKIDLSRFRSLGRSSHSPHPTGPPPGPQQAGPYYGPYHGGPPQGAPLPASPHAQHRHVEVPRPPMEPLNHDPEESGFHIPFAKRPRRDTDGRSRAGQQARHEQSQQSYIHQERQPGPFAPLGLPSNQHEPPHSLLDQLAIAAVPEEHPRYRDEPMPQAPMGMHQPLQEEVWRSPGGTHRVVQFDNAANPPPHLLQTPRMAASGLAPPSRNQQTRSPSQGRKRSLQDEDHEGDESVKMQGGFRRSMRRALSMSMEDAQRPAALLKALDDAAEKEASEMKSRRGRTKKSVTPEDGKPNVKYVKPQGSKGNLKEKTVKVEKKPASPVRGRKGAGSKAKKEPEPEHVTPEKRGRGRPPKAASAKAKKAAKLSEAVEESEDEEEDEQTAVEEQLLQDEKRTTRKAKEEKKGKEQKEEEDTQTPGRTFRSVRLQAKYIGKEDGKK